MSTGEGSPTSFETIHGRNYPTLRQFTVFLENRVGQLLEVVRRFEGTGIRIVALSINDSAECARYPGCACVSIGRILELRDAVAVAGSGSG